MKRKITISIISAAFAVLTLTSYGSGPFIGGAGNRTGSASSTGDCSTGGCHAANTVNTTVTLALRTLSDVPVSTYTASTTYKLVISGTNTSALPRFGFQISCVDPVSQTQAGSFTATAPNTGVHNASGIQLVEHNLPIAATAGTYITSVNWTSPATASGSIRFYAMLNAVNYDGTNSGDMPNQGILTIPGASTGISNHRLSSLSVYPNPAVNVLHIKLPNTGEKAVFKVWDMGGRLVLGGETDADAAIVVTKLGMGSYFILATQGGHEYIGTFLKKN